MLLTKLPAHGESEQLIVNIYSALLAVTPAQLSEIFMGLPYRAAEYTEVSLSSIRATANIIHYLCLDNYQPYSIAYSLQNDK